MISFIFFNNTAYKHLKKNYIFVFNKSGYPSQRVLRTKSLERDRAHWMFTCSTLLFVCQIRRLWCFWNMQTIILLSESTAVRQCLWLYARKVRTLAPSEHTKPIRAPICPPASQQFSICVTCVCYRLFARLCICVYMELERNM